MLRWAIAAQHTDLCFFFPGHTEFADPRRLTSFQLHVPLPPQPTWNTNVGAGTFFISRIFVKSPPCLSPAPSNWLHMSFFWCYEGVKQLGKAATEPSHHPQRPSCLWLGSPAPVTPIKIGSLAVFTKPSSHLIELEQLRGSRSAVRWVFFFFFSASCSLSIDIQHFSYSPTVLEVSPVITSNEEGKELFTWKEHMTSAENTLFRLSLRQNRAAAVVWVWFVSILMFDDRCWFRI